MDPTDITIEILKSIRDEIKDVRSEMRDGLADVRSEIQETHAGLQGVRTEIKETRERLEKRQTETEMRLATELVGVAAAVLQVRDLLQEDRTVRTRVEDHERRIAAIEKKVS